MDGRLVELGIGLIAAILVIREVLGFLDKKKFHNGDSLEHGAVMNEHLNDVRYELRTRLTTCTTGTIKLTRTECLTGMSGALLRM